jgi:hypothetical protein
MVTAIVEVLVKLRWAVEDNEMVKREVAGAVRRAVRRRNDILLDVVGCMSKVCVWVALAELCVYEERGEGGGNSHYVVNTSIDDMVMKSLFRDPFF